MLQLLMLREQAQLMALKNCVTEELGGSDTKNITDQV